MKKSVLIITTAAVIVSLAAVLFKKKGKTNLKITCQCGKDSEKTELAVTEKDVNDSETVNVALPANVNKGPISLAFNNASVGNVSYSITIN